MSDLDLMSDTATALMWITGAGLWLGLLARHTRRRLARRRRATYQRTGRGVSVDITLGL